MSAGRIFIGTRLLWLAWYPLRGRRCQLSWQRHDTSNSRYYFEAAVGPAYLGLGPGVPLP